MNKVALLVVGLALAAGCKKQTNDKPAPPPPPAAPDAGAAVAAPLDAAAEVIDAPPPPLTPAVPAGKVGIQINDLEYGGYSAPGLPAIKADGSQFAVVSLADDGGRGFLDLTLRLLDGTTGKPVKEWQLADPDKTNGDNGDGATPAVLDAAKAAVAEANAMLAGAEWRSLTVVELPVDADKQAATAITAGDLTFTYDAEKVTVTSKAGGKPIVKTYQQVTGQKAPAGAKPTDEDESPCTGASEYLRSVAVDATSKRALLAFDFVTGHNCGDDGQVYGVIALP